nr:expressed protein [Hymenolepis microstoma]
MLPQLIFVTLASGNLCDNIIDWPPRKIVKILFESLKEEFPKLKDIVPNIPDAEERKKLGEYVQSLTVALEEERNSSLQDSIFFINCSLTSWGLLLFELSCSAEKIRNHRKKQECLACLEETTNKLKRLLGVLADMKVKLRNPYRHARSAARSRVETDASKEQQESQVEALTRDLEALNTQTHENEHEGPNLNPADSGQKRCLRDPTNSKES